ncbi:S9 family peptidase [Kineococcus rubinsiae]|uniref:S9 family peptidase n=1 Tax=Kineococcus rubinsiae TaxID=2609562 RepID=UPI00142F825D|nr:prolyl oligopeptidase family serine peptidase [Kineococcus rubinsiae]NIZ93090.1 S9 family peptidase [Kineococcus rubinsiae]
MTAPHGAWPSPLSAAEVARTGLHLGAVALDRGGRRVWWAQGDPADGGRVAVLRRDEDGTVTELAPSLDARTRVHEYGGGSWLPVGDGAVLADAGDQRWYAVDAPGAAPRPLTPDVAARPRLADPDRLDEDAVVLVAEDLSGPEPARALVRVALDGSGVTELFRGPRFLAAPRTSPDGRRLTWISWEHPDMPWQRTLLWTADVGADHRLSGVRVVAGGESRESLVHPGWTADGTLLVVSDRSGWWNLHRVEETAAGEVAGGGAELVALLPEAAEQGFPPWVFGTTSWAALDDGRVALLHGSATYALDVLDPRTGALTALDLPFTAYAAVLAGAGSQIAAVSASATMPPTVVVVDAQTSAVQVVQPSGEVPDAAVLPVPHAVTVPSAGGRVVHAHRYPPTNALVDPDGGQDEPAPHVLFVHGGPTSQSQAAFSPEVAYFTSRGIGVVDVQYGGSTGYGRAYREALDGAWGIVDVEDCVAVARWLVEAGLAPADRIGIRGGSAGGFTVLACLTGTDAFSAGTSYYGVADLRALAEDTHDFESRYLDSLVGPLPAAADVYAARAPLNHVDGLSCPVLLLQGADDLVVPRAQAEQFAEALQRKGLPHALVVFPGEQHGFRKAENVATSLEAELSFYGQVWGFDPPGVPRLELVRPDAEEG